MLNYELLSGKKKEKKNEGEKAIEGWYSWKIKG